MEITTPRLVLREFVADDAAALRAYGSEAAELVPTFVDWAVAAPRLKMQLAITLRGQLIGTCGVRKDGPESLEAELGCELAPSAWGAGYAREACEAVLRRGFEALGVARVVARTAPTNAAAIRLAESLGFTHLGDGLLAIDRPEWTRMARS